MSEILNPNLFLFQELTIQILQFLKKSVRKTKLDDLDIAAFVNQTRSPNIIKYTELLSVGLASSKTRDQLFQYYDKIYKQNLAESRNLPDGLVASMLEGENDISLHLGRLFATWMTHHTTFLTNGERSRCLKYLLEGTRHKVLGREFSVFLGDSLEYLSSHRSPPINSFLVHFVNHLANEVELHEAEPTRYSLELHAHQSGGKYGRCFMCGAPAANYDKEMLLPLCGFDCKGSLTELRVRVNLSEQFDLFSWLIDQCVFGDEIVFRQIGRELRNEGASERVAERHLRVLLPELLKNAQQGNQQMVAECHRIFVSIFESYRVTFRNELKAYLKEMARQLQAETETGGKISLLKLFSELFQNADNINSIFANYDCKFYETNLLEEQMGLIGRLSIALDQDESVRREAKFCMVSLLRGELEYLRRRPASVKQLPAESSDDLLKEKKVKAHIQKAIKLFNSKPLAGIRYLRENYFEDKAMTAADVAMFIRQNEEMEVRGAQAKLKKDKMGEYFGSPNPEAIQVYQAYLDLLSFENLSVDDALRELFNHFTLPKENQEISRVIEYFCNKFFPYSGLASSSGFYQLVYAIIMLQTSLHNPNVKPNEKLKLADFLSICSNIEGKPDKAIVEKLFYSIAERPLSERPEFSSEYVLSKGYLNPYQEDQYVETASSTAGLVSLLEYIWQYLYVGLVDRDNVDGLYEAVLVYGSCDMEEAEGFISALVKLAEKGSMEAHDNILRLAAYDNGTLGRCWSQIFSFMFEMEENQTSASSANSRFDTSVVDQILTASSGLPFPKFIEFLQQFCSFASSHTKDGKYTRQLFVLRHIIEIVEYNLPRLKSLWGFLWPLLHDFYVKLCLHPRTNISISAIDSLKQLALKLMRLPEDEVIQQSTFLSPFLYVYERSGAATKELIVNIIGMLISKEMATGWQVIYAILEKADENEAVIKVADRILTIGLGTVLHPSRLHRILVKELVTINDSHQLIPKLLELLTSVSAHLDSAETTLETLKALLDKYQICEHPDLLRCFFDMIESTEHRTPEVFQLILQLLAFTNRVKDYARSSLVNGYVNLVHQDFLLANFDRWRDSWLLNLESPNRRALLPMFYEAIRDNLQSFGAAELDKVLELLLAKHDETLPKQLLQLSGLDPDFERVLSELPVASSSKADLIQLALERDLYEYKCILHLLVLNLFSLLAKRASVRFRERITDAAKRSFEDISNFNQKVLLRYFLWKNGFMSAHGDLPGLLKQGIQASELLIDLLLGADLKQFSCRLLSEYSQVLSLKKKIETMDVTSLKPIYRQEVDSYLGCYKGVLAKAFAKLQTADLQGKATDLYLLVLEVLEKTNDRELVRDAKAVMRLLLKKQWEQPAAPSG